MSVLLAAALQSSSMLVLDARQGQPACGSGSTIEIDVCGSELPATRLPMSVNGKPGVVLIEPGGPDEFTCNQDFVVRAGIFGEGPLPLISVGPIKVVGAFGEITVLVSGQKVRRFARWTNRPSVRNADCVVGPRGLNYDRVKFVLGPPQPNASITALPFYPRVRGSIYGSVPVGEDTIAVRFELDHSRSVLTAPAARIVARALGGTVTGPTELDHVAMGVSRPIRKFLLQKPLRVGSLSLQNSFVRVSDYGDATNIRYNPMDELQPGDLVVTGRFKNPGRIKLMRIGRSDLSSCSSITVDLRGKRIELAC